MAAFGPSAAYTRRAAVTIAACASRLERLANVVSKKAAARELRRAAALVRKALAPAERAACAFRRNSPRRSANTVQTVE